jgi:hypothetical protein
MLRKAVSKERFLREKSRRQRIGRSARRTSRALWKLAVSTGAGRTGLGRGRFPFS